MATVLSRPDAAAAVEGLGWSYLLGQFLSYVPVESHADALEVAALAVRACGADEDHLGLDLRPGRVDLAVFDRVTAHVTDRDAELVRAITEALAGKGFTATVTADDRPHGVQLVEFAIDTMDAGRIRPFWKAVLGYVDEPGTDGPWAALVDPLRRSSPLWFQQMDEPRPQRNRIHFDLTVPHEQAEARVAAAVAAGGTVVTDEYARSFWVLADPDGNEICICTWQDREA